MGSKNINSFADNVAKLVKETNTAIASLNAINETMTTDKDVVNIELSGEGNIPLPSYNSLINRIKNVENTVDSFSSGSGIVKLTDGTHRYVKVTNVPNVPQKITSVEAPSSFNIIPNWFFEELMFPKVAVKLDLTGKVDDNSDRLKMCRIIIPKNDSTVDFYIENIKNKSLDYNTLLNTLDINGISYFKDEDIVDFPLTTQKLIGEFVITKTDIIDGEIWYYLDDMYYGIDNQNDNNVLKNINLSVNNTLKFKNSLFKIEKIDLNLKRVHIVSKLGFDVPSVGEEFTIYESPFAIKEIQISIGMNEINCIYLKGVNEDYNLLASEWSEPINFITNELLFDENNNETLETYYYDNIADFGNYWISDAKEKKIPSTKGITPNTPQPSRADFRVEQVNKQVNSTLNDTEVVKTASQIASLRTSISSSRNAINKLKNNLLTTTVQAERYNLQNLITNEENALANNTTEYKSLVNHLNAFIKDNKLSDVKPKYRIRGFFPIPEPQYIFDAKNNKTKSSKQEIIGFEIKYRYIKTDETGVELSTYNFKDGKNTINGVFSDWNIIKTPFKEKVYDATTDSWHWEEQNVGDGNTININQIDIPITSGEKVEFMIRSISEAGFPYNSLKSNWSEPIIVDFPSNLSTNNQLSNILEDVKADATSIKLEEVLNSAGFYNHTSDEIISNGDVTKMYHHNVDNIFYKKLVTNDNGTNEIKTVSVADVIADIYNKLSSLTNNYNTISTSVATLNNKLPSDLTKYNGNVYLINGILYEQEFDSSTGELIGMKKVDYKVKDTSTSTN